MIKITDITSTIENLAPLRFQEDYDNAGLLIGDFETNCTGVLCTLDATEAVIHEAVARNCNLVVAHHPILFRAVKHLQPSDYVRQTLVTAIKNDIAIYAAHTNLDNVIEGVNGKIADKLALTDRHILSEVEPGRGSGLIGSLPGPLDQEAFLALLYHQFKTGIIRHNGAQLGKIQRVAICGGAGSFLINKALEAKADAYVTADLKYHEFFDAGAKMLLCDIGHFESEQFTIDLFHDLLRGKLRNFAVLKSEIVTNPVHYFTGK